MLYYFYKKKFVLSFSTDDLLCSIFVAILSLHVKILYVTSYSNECAQNVIYYVCTHRTQDKIEKLMNKDEKTEAIAQRLCECVCMLRTRDIEIEIAKSRLFYKQRNTRFTYNSKLYTYINLYILLGELSFYFGLLASSRCWSPSSQYHHHHHHHRHRCHSLSFEIIVLRVYKFSILSQHFDLNGATASLWYFTPEIHTQSLSINV